MSNKDTNEEETPCIVEKIRDYRKDKIDPILENGKNTEEIKEKLVEELQRVRFSYNVWNGFTSGFIITFFGTFITLLVGNFLPKNIKSYIGLWTLAGIFVIISVVQVIFLRTANTSYEKMKLVEDELEKINNTVQPNSKK